MAQRISIGFHASPPLSARVTDEQLGELQKALGGDGWHDLEADDASIRLNVAQVLWVRVEKAESSVGFGTR